LPRRHKSAKTGPDQEQDNNRELYDFFAAKSRQPSRNSYKNQSVPLHDAHRARDQIQTDLQVQAKAQHDQADTAQEPEQLARWRIYRGQNRPKHWLFGRFVQRLA
jgi:hypothetical protein